MPVSRSGGTFEVYSVPNGVGMARPPANSLPPGAVWQATQSPAWARYSPWAAADAAAFGAWAEACAINNAATITEPAAAQRRLFRNGGRSGIVCPSVWF